MKTSSFTRIKYWLLVLPAIAFILSCNYSQPQLTPDEIWHVQKRVTRFTNHIAVDLSVKGPVAWLNYIQDTSNFFMANNGELNFKDYRSAVAFIQDTLAKSVSKINLKWSNMRIDPLSNSIASIGSNYHEEITGNDGKITTYDGYFTGTAILIDDEWKLRNLHWSAKLPK